MNMSQRGVGMMEVLVALLLLAIGVMGFTALQVRASVATEEAAKRSQAMEVLAGLGEQMRTNPNANYVTATASNKNCRSATATCTVADRAADDLYWTTLQASKQDITLDVIDCPGLTGIKRACLVAAWGKTSVNSCVAATGGYQDNSTCLLMEAYPS